MTLLPIGTRVRLVKPNPHALIHNYLVGLTGVVVGHDETGRHHVRPDDLAAASTTGYEHREFGHIWTWDVEKLEVIPTVTELTLPGSRVKVLPGRDPHPDYVGKEGAITGQGAATVRVKFDDGTTGGRWVRSNLEVLREPKVGDRVVVHGAAHLDHKMPLTGTLLSTEEDWTPRHAETLNGVKHRFRVMPDGADLANSYPWGILAAEIVLLDEEPEEPTREELLAQIESLQGALRVAENTAAEYDKDRTTLIDQRTELRDEVDRLMEQRAGILVEMDRLAVKVTDREKAAAELAALLDESAEQHQQIETELVTELDEVHAALDFAFETMNQRERNRVAGFRNGYAKRVAEEG